MRSTLNRSRILTLAGLVLGAGVPAVATATDLSNNLANATAGTEAVGGSRWAASSFGTGTSARTLNSVTLLMSGPAAGAADVEIRADGGLEPGVLVATLIAPSSFPTTLSPVTFRTPGLALAANKTYWVVLHPSVGSFAWAWTASDSGLGAGFQHTWGVSEDSGAFWWSYDNYAAQMKVVTDSCACPADFDCDGFVTGNDFDTYVDLYIAGNAAADFNQDGFVTGDDFDLFTEAFLAGC